MKYYYLTVFPGQQREWVQRYPSLHSAQKAQTRVIRAFSPLGVTPETQIEAFPRIVSLTTEPTQFAKL